MPVARLTQRSGAPDTPGVPELVRRPLLLRLSTRVMAIFFTIAFILHVPIAVPELLPLIGYLLRDNDDEADEEGEIVIPIDFEFEIPGEETPGATPEAETGVETAGAGENPTVVVMD